MDIFNKWSYICLCYFVGFSAIVLIGTRINTADPSIIPAQDAPDGKYPYVVSLRNHWCEHFCGGSIIHKRWILTTAHCLEHYQNDTVDVIAGTNLDPGDEEQDYQSEYIKRHDEWNKPQFSNDIGLIRVSRDIKFNNRVQLIPLKIRNFNKGCYRVTVIGWKQSGSGDFAVAKLQEFFLKSISQHQCKKKFADWIEIDKSHICSSTKDRKGICHGDSGGPLVADGLQIGVTINIPCTFEHPGLYTRVHTYLKWIETEKVKFGD